MKRIFKKSVAIFAAFTLLLSLCGIPAAAASVPKITVGTAHAAPGENVKVDIVLSDCEKFSSYTIQVRYENQYLTAVSATEGIDVSLYMPNLTVGGEKELLVTGGSINNVTENGALATLEFAVSPDYPGGITEVPLVVTSVKLTEFDGTKDKHINSESYNGRIIISKTGGGIIWNDSSDEHDLTLEKLPDESAGDYTNPLTGEKVEDGGNYYVNEDEKIAIPAEDAEAKLDSDPDNWKVNNAESVSPPSNDTSDNSGNDGNVHADKEGFDTMAVILCVAGGVVVILAAVLAYVFIRKKK